MTLRKINLAAAFERVTQFWSPVIGGDINDSQVKLAKFKGAFEWHHHEKEDEMFLVTQGELMMRLRPEDGGDITLRAGEYLIVPHGVEHCPLAVSDEVHCLLFEPRTTLNTGMQESERTQRSLQRLDRLGGEDV